MRRFAAPYVSSPVAVGGSLRASSARSFRVLREHDVGRLRQQILVDTAELLEASAVRYLELDADAGIRVGGYPGNVPLPASALLMEAELLPRARREEKSLISSHPRLDPALGDLAQECAHDGVITHVLLLRAYAQTQGAVGVHWIGRERPEFERRRGFYGYLENAALAVALSNERRRLDAAGAKLREQAYRDTLTGLPNTFALEEQLAAHSETIPFSVVVLDFDGMREANNALGYTEGGDVLIATVGRALAGLVRDREFAARMHTAGDEFAVLLPQADADQARTRAETIEGRLDALEVPATHREIYHGASAGWATRQPSETPGQTLGRASTAMRQRKNERTDR